MGRRSHSMLLTVIGIALLGFGGGRASGAPEADPLLAAVPAQATGAAIIDLRPDTESMKALRAVHTPEQGRALSAGTLLALQVALTRWAPGLDLEKDVLPWLTRRAAICWVPGADPKRPDALFLIETAGGTPAAASFDQCVQAAVKAERAAPATPADGVPVWKLAVGKDGILAANLGNAIALTRSEGALVQAVAQARAAAAGGPPAPAALAASAAPPGLFRIAANPQRIQADAQGPGKTLGIAGLGGALRLTPAGLVVEAAAPTMDDTGAWTALAQIRPTFAESVAGIPGNAVAALVAARPALWVHAANIPIFDAIAGGFIGPPAIKALGPALGPLLSDLFGQEVAVGILPAGGRLGWLAVLTSARPNELPAMVQRLTGMGGAEGVQWQPAPLGQNPAWVLRLPLRPGAPATELHVALLGARLLVASTRTGLEAGVATLAGQQKPATDAAWLNANADLIGANPLVKAGAEVRTLAPLLAAQLGARVGIPPTYLARLADALLAGCNGLSVGVRLDGGTVRVVGVVGLDYPKLAAMGGVTVPAVAVILGGALSEAEAKARAAKAAPAQP